MSERTAEGHWVGVDWGESSHAIAVIDKERRIKKRFEITHSIQGMEELVTTLAAFQPVLGVAIESSRNLIMAHLLVAGYVLYPINPKLSAAWRENENVSGCKSDKRDGLVLARELSVRWEQLKPMRPEGEEMRTLALLCEDEQRLIAERTRHVQRLQSTLKLYFPAALEFFSDWTAPAAWQWLKKFPTPQRFAKASDERLYKFLREHRIGISPEWKKRVEGHGDAAKWAVDKATVVACELRALSEVELLVSIEQQLGTYRKRIEALAASQSDHALFKSLPGAGKKLAPRLLSIFGTDRDRYETVDAIRLLSGIAPVMKQSGKSNKASLRRACKKPWRNTMHLFAERSKPYCPWAKAYYDHRKASGDGNAQALRKLADKWVKIIYRMWREKTPYNETQYVESLYRRNSPLVKYLAVDNPVENAE